jgi:hypothetical protein
MSKGAGMCAQVPLVVACVAPFLAGPRAQIGYSMRGRTVSQSLALPVVAPKFCTPPDAPVAKEAFFQRWRAVEGALSLVASVACIRVSFHSLEYFIPWAQQVP